MRRTNASLGHDAKVDPLRKEQHWQDSRRRQETGGFGSRREGRADAKANGILIALNVVQKNAGFWDGCKLLILERETGFEPATSSLGITAALCY
jgi:hypothetical protein